MKITKTHQDKEKIIINVSAQERTSVSETKTINPKTMMNILSEQKDLLKNFFEGPVSRLNVVGEHQSNKHGSFDVDYVITKKQESIENTNNVTKFKKTASKKKAVKQNGKN